MSKGFIHKVLLIFCQSANWLIVILFQLSFLISVRGVLKSIKNVSILSSKLNVVACFQYVYLSK